MQRAFAHYADLDTRPGGGAEVPYARLLAFCKAFNLLPSLLSLTQAFVNFRASRTADDGGEHGADADEDGGGGESEEDAARRAHSLTYPEFVEFVGRCALCAFAAPYLAKQHPTPEAKARGRLHHSDRLLLLSDPANPNTIDRSLVLSDVPDRSPRCSRGCTRRKAWPTSRAPSG